MCQVVVLLSVHLQIDPQLRGWIYSPAPLKKSPRNPGQTVHASAPSKLVYLLLICHWRGRGFSMPRSPSMPAPIAKSFICPFIHCLPIRLSETKNDCGGRPWGRSWAVREPRHPKSEQRAAKVEHSSTCPFEKKLHLFRMNEGAVLRREEDCEGFWRGEWGLGSSAPYPAAPMSQHFRTPFQRLTLSRVSQMVSERSGRNVHSRSQRSNLSFYVLQPKRFMMQWFYSSVQLTCRFKFLAFYYSEALSNNNKKSSIP